MKHTGDYELDEINILEQECADLEEDNERLEEENKNLTKCNLNLQKHIDKVEEENKKLKEFKSKQEEMMFLIWASIELAKPKTYIDTEKLQKGKEIYEKLYKKELYYLREENQKLEEELERYKKQYEHSMWEDKLDLNIWII